MKVMAQTAALQEALALAGGIVAARTPKPVLRCVKLVAAEGLLTVLATDLEVGCRYQVAAVEVQEEGEALVPADRLSGIVRESGDQESLTLQTDKQLLHVRGAASHFQIFGYDPGEYPAVAEFGDAPALEMPAADLIAMIGKTLFATARVHSHYAMSGILWEAKGKKLKLVATDGHRLAQAKGGLSKAAPAETQAIAPTKLMSLLQRLADGEQTVEVRFEENQILVRSAHVVLISSLVQGNFPKYEDVIPKECTCKATFNTAQFEHRLRQAALLTDEQSRGVNLSFEPEAVTLSSRAPEAGEAEVTCPVQYEGEPLKIAFNPTFVLDALRVVETDEATLEMNAAGKPAVIRSGSDFLYVLMPVDLT